MKRAKRQGDATRVSKFLTFDDQCHITRISEARKSFSRNYVHKEACTFSRVTSPTSPADIPSTPSGLGRQIHAQRSLSRGELREDHIRLDTR
jgi:hypothetical protein